LTFFTLGVGDQILIYTQESKNRVRHKALFYAVEALTTNRNQSCCVQRPYVRNVLDYFLELGESRDKKEAEEVDINYIQQWEKLHDSCVGMKKAEDLVVCYLAGPEPKNDFEELISLGVHPKNIWTFENDKNTFKSALQQYSHSEFPQPKIIKGNIEHFFKDTPKKFDLVYIDACGAIASEKKCLRIIASLCKYHRLSSLGVIITNFAYPDLSKPTEEDEYSKLIAAYLFFKAHPNTSINEDKMLESDSFKLFEQEIRKDLDKHYGELITASIIDISSLAIPIQRFVNSGNAKTLYNNVDDEFKQIENNSLYNFLSFTSKINNSKINSLIREFSGIENFPIDIHKCFKSVHDFKKGKVELQPEVSDLLRMVDKELDIHQFLDRPNKGLFLDLIVNQFAYPLHYNSEAIKRYEYIAKETNMFLDIIVLDECRYIYEWLPTIYQISNAIKNKSWQYIFRFALDGLVKHRLKYNNEYFFQGSVISQTVAGFENKIISERKFIE